MQTVNLCPCIPLKRHSTVLIPQYISLTCDCPFTEPVNLVSVGLSVIASEEHDVCLCFKLPSAFNSDEDLTLPCVDIPEVGLHVCCHFVQGFVSEGVFQHSICHPGSVLKGLPPTGTWGGDLYSLLWLVCRIFIFT